MNPTISDAIQILAPNTEWVCYGDYPNYTLNWINPEVAPVTDAQINAEYKNLLAQAVVADNKAKATELLSATDWVNEPDAIDPTRNPHLLNQTDFLSYREALRQIAVNPPSTEVTNWPVKPTTIWSS